MSESEIVGIDESQKENDLNQNDGQGTIIDNRRTTNASEKSISWYLPSQARMRSLDRLTGADQGKSLCV